MTPIETTLWVSGTLLVSYLAGALPFGYLIGKCKGVDIRKCGSGNIGATNVTRVIGRWWGRLCFALDFVKGFVPVFVVGLLAARGVVRDEMGLLPSLAAFAAVCGHIWPVYLGFKGGKGVSTAAGCILALNPPALLTAGATWVVLFYATRYVSLASIFAALVLPAAAFVFEYFRIRPASKAEIILFCLLAILTILKHGSNIRRLLNGTENKFEKKKES